MNPTRQRRHPAEPGALARVAAVIWVIALVVGLGYAILVNDMAELYCEPIAGSSDYGAFAWSIVPPGPTCTFTDAVHGFDEVRGPTPVMSVWLLALAAGAMWILPMLTRSRRSAVTGESGSGSSDE
jgi:hypothetical protein